MGFVDIRAVARIAAVLMIVTVAASAHEIGTTQARAVFRKDHTYSIEVITSPQSLRRRLTSATDIRFDNLRVVPRVEVESGGQRPPAVPDSRGRLSSTSSFVVLRFSGEIPQRATAFTWQSKLTYAAYSLTLENEGHGDGTRQWLDGDQRSAPFPLASDVLPPTRLQVVRQYLELGFTHIVPYGLDHILFVLGIFLLSTKLKPVLTQVTAFTIAHSITLGLTIYGVVSVSPHIVEPAIALSIPYVAIENLTTSKLRPWRVAIVFAFGLLHGMGFAGVLKDLGLPRSEFLTALLTFNIGVEAGQISVIAAAWLLVACWARTKPWYRYRFVMPASALIAATGIFWTVQRALSVLSVLLTNKFFP